ncbi:MAG: CapA family protein [Treponema sp.]|nr:CapA family protein [Treponema sp.]
MKLIYVILFAALLCGCNSVYDYVSISDIGEYSREAAFVKSILEGNEDIIALGLRIHPDTPGNYQGSHQPLLRIEFLSSWEFEGAYGDILISRKILIPRDDMLAERTDTTLASCLDGSETLIEIDELEPPFVALRVDGLALGDNGYPLCRAVGIRFHTLNESKSNDSAFLQKIAFLENLINQSPKPLVQTMPEPLWITSGGDMMLERGATEILLSEGPAGIFGRTAEMFASSDVALVNLEGVISARGERVPKSYNFRFVPEVAAALRDTGIDAVLHANNHVFDYGEEAFLDSLSWLHRAGVGVVGAGIDDDAASEPFVFSKGEDTCRVFGIASFPRERNGWDGETVAALPDRPGMLHARVGGREKLKERMAPNDATLNVILFHGGIEYSPRSDAATRELYTDLIASGADLVIGTHPHVVQGFEWVLGKPVFWSLGNFIFGGMNYIDGASDGLFIRLGYWRGRLLYLEPFPVYLDNVRTDIAAQERLAVFYARSRDLRRMQSAVQP